jgi:hypothetical protein
MAIDQAIAAPERVVSAANEQFPKPKLPGPIDVVKQVYADLFGKDVQETATFSYEWVADQMGHFSLGFMITYLLSWIFYPTPPANSLDYFKLAGWVMLVFIVKELRDFVSEWWKSRTAKSVFKFNSIEILYNVATALFYILLGSLVAGFALWNPRYGIVAVAITVPLALILGYFWLRLKITFQQAGLPYLYRLATFPSPIDKKTAQFIVELSKPAPSGEKPTLAHHLIIAGPLDSGKSSLATAIGTEFAFRLGIGCYTTLAKLLQSALRTDGNIHKAAFDDGRILWPWQNSDLLIVDDVDVLSDHIPGTPTDVSKERMIAQTRVDTLKALIPDVLQAALKYRRTVWVVGDIDDGELKHWQAMIADIIGVDPARVWTFKFAMKIEELDPQRPRPAASEQVAQ